MFLTASIAFSVTARSIKFFFCFEYQMAASDDQKYDDDS